MSGKHNRDSLKDAIVRGLVADRLLEGAESALTNLLTGIPESEMSDNQRSGAKTLKEIGAYLRPAEEATTT